MHEKDLGMAFPFESTDIFSRSENGLVRRCKDHACRPNAPLIMRVTVGHREEIGVFTNGFSRIATIKQLSIAKYLNLFKQNF